MRRIVAVIAGFAALVTTANVQAGSAGPDPIHTSKTRFRIPYRYDDAEMRKIGAMEIRLYVSVDEGRHWRHAQTVAPAAGRFEFVAPGEGDYWFAVRTLDAGRRLHPPGDAIEPGLKVIVDSTPPELDIDLFQTEPGRVQLSWNARDRFLDTGQLRLEYLQSGFRQWQPVSIIPQAAGQTSWSLPLGGVVAVRGSIGDFASNVTQTERELVIAPAPAGSPTRSTPADGGPIAGRVNGTGFASRSAQYNSRGPAFGGGPIAGRPGEGRTIEAGGPALSGGPIQDGSVAALNQWPAAGAKIPGISENPRDRNADAGPNLGNPGALPRIAGRQTAMTPERGVSGQLISNLLTREPAINDGPSPAGGQRTRFTANGSRARIVNTTAFDINYQIGEVGPSGVGAVEFFITPNGGAKWWKFGDDLDRESPFRVKVPGDGTYGFDVRVRSGVGLAADPPQPGEKPSIVVIVDQTPPVVQLYPAQQGQGASLNKILVRWKAEDENPADESISLAYSAGPNGPWTPICDWRKDAGSFLWTVGADVPPSLYIALSVRDAAGNVRQVVTPNPVIVDLTKPSAKIVDVLPPADVERR